MEERPEESDIVLALAVAAEGPGTPTLWAAKGSGLFRSRDLGKSWASVFDSLALDAPLATTAIAAAPDTDDQRTLFAGALGAILVSVNFGNAWQISSLGTPPPLVSAIAVSPSYQTDGTVFATTLEDGVFRSTDRGRTWVSSNFGLLDLGVLTLALSPKFASDETVYAGTETGIYASTNGGRAWRDIEPADELGTIQSLAISPAYETDDTLVAATETNGLWRSRDRGTTWNPCGSERQHVSAQQVILDPHFEHRPRVIALTATEIRWSSNRGDSWSSLHTWSDEADAVSTMAVLDWSVDPPAIIAGRVDGQVRQLS